MHHFLVPAAEPVALMHSALVGKLVRVLPVRTPSITTIGEMRERLVPRVLSSTFELRVTPEKSDRHY